jgi:hypothetical protein
VKRVQGHAASARRVVDFRVQDCMVMRWLLSQVGQRGGGESAWSGNQSVQKGSRGKRGISIQVAWVQRENFKGEKEGDRSIWSCEGYDPGILLRNIYEISSPTKHAINGKFQYIAPIQLSMTGGGISTTSILSLPRIHLS